MNINYKLNSMRMIFKLDKVVYIREMAYVKWIYLLMALAGGLAVGIQAVVNGGLGKKVGTLEASFISFSVGTAALFFVVLFFGKGNLLAVSEVPKSQLIGGLLGAFYVIIMVMTVPKLGVSSGSLCGHCRTDNNGSGHRSFWPLWRGKIPD